MGIFGGIDSRKISGDLIYQQRSSRNDPVNITVKTFILNFIVNSLFVNSQWFDRKFFTSL